MESVAEALRRGGHGRARERRTAEPRPTVRVSKTSEGRGGQVRYCDDRRALELWWEFALPPALALVGVPTVAQ